MKQILQNFKSGELKVHEVPAPILQPHGVLVRTHYSVISAGTEGGTVRLAKKNLLEKARTRPDLVKKVLNVARNDGLATAYQAVANNLDSPVPLGYSLAGEVVAVGSKISDLKIGDRVACFGSMVANHAEINFIPRNLCVRVPHGVDLRHAAFCMIAAIALNGVRRAEVEIGCNVLVVGLGLIGQITAQLLKASGCQVFGIDIDIDKLELARKSGVDVAMLRGEANIEEAVMAFSDGLGVDATIITAAVSTADPIALAGRVTRQRGRVVALGRVPYELPRDEYLFKEIDFVTTLAFGPGVNDPDYETKGVDYPAAFVRWSGNRNIQATLNLINGGQINLEPLITHEFSLDQVDNAFALMTGENSEASVAVLLQYDVRKPWGKSRYELKQHTQFATNAKPGIGVIGAGSHAVSFLLKAIDEQDVSKRGIISAGGFKSKWYGEKHGYSYATDDPLHVFEDETINAVFVLSRHDSHADLTIRALEHGKDVFVEKPICLTEDELDAIVAAKNEYGGRIMVGYNRRFAPLGVKLKERFSKRAQPMSILYRMNAGFRPAKHWLHDLEVGGGLILGEAIHFIDFMQYLVGAPPVKVFAQSLHSSTRDIIDADNVIINVQYADGSTGVLSYLSNGDASFGRERIEVFCDNTIAVSEDWRYLVFSKDGKKEKTKHNIIQDKGFVPEVAAFVKAISSEERRDTDFSEVVAGMRVAFAALTSLRRGCVVDLAETTELQ
ncbi:bi-domain-containing oxidoreductase [Desulfogranum japonicum]|uniref:bi-domain-containing oxidoreductase n=1 Tax=Desulfogranum japonicum TaxID=231447 RepID=UPI0004138BCC|nr:bi-domain-containing oxidoreductase [Desulfogranum japonicum]